MKETEFINLKHFKETYDFLIPVLKASGCPNRPHLGIVCGSGLGKLVEALDKVYIEIPYSDIPHFSQSTVAGHSGKLVFGKVKDMVIAIMVGRLHFYEGYSQAQIAFPAAALCGLGIEALLLTNAAGGLNVNYKKGDIMILRDHLNFPGIGGQSSLRGPVMLSSDLNKLLESYQFGQSKKVELLEEFLRFPSLHQAYSKDLQTLFARSAIEAEFPRQKIRSGVYAYNAGPAYESLSEVHVFKKLGVDAVGMSTVPEVLIATHMRVKVVAFSLISNEVPDPIFPIGDDWLFEPKKLTKGHYGSCSENGTLPEGPTHQEVIEATNASAEHLIRVIRKFVENLPQVV